MILQMRLVSLGMLIGIFSGCGGNIDLFSLASGGHTNSQGGLGGEGHSANGAGGSTSAGGSSTWGGPAGGGPGSETSAGAPDGGELPSGGGGWSGFDAAQAGALSVGGRQAPRAPGFGGNAPVLEGWLASDIEKEHSYRVLNLASANHSCSLEITSPLVQSKHPAFSPDGSELAYATNESGRFQIHVRTLATGHVRRVTDLQTGATFPSWSPDGSKLVMIEGDPELDQRQFGQRVLLLDLTTGELRSIFTQVADAPGYSSPVFASADLVLVGNGGALIAISVSDGTNRDVVPVTTRIPNPIHPSASPDGLRFVFQDYCGPDRPNVFVANIDGSTGDTCEAATELGVGASPYLVDPPSFGGPAWGPFGLVAAESEEGVVLLPEQGGPAVAVLNEWAGRQHNLTWAPRDFSINCR
jgi:hypothetical protein